MLKKLFSIFAALTLSAGLWADSSVFTYTAEDMLSEDKLNEWLGEGKFTHDFDAPNGTITCTEEVTELPEAVFRDSHELLSFELPTSVTAIGVDAFSSCAQLQSITMPNVTEIGNYAFNGCQSLQSVTMPNVTEIGNNVFMACGSLQSITLPASVTAIGGGAFSSCTALQSITLPAGVTAIGDDVFMDCTALQSVTFEGTSCTIGEDAFAGVGEDTPATLNLPAGWTGSKPDEEGNWYGGYFVLAAPAKGDLTAEDFEISNNTVTYNGEAKAATVALKSTVIGAGTITVSYKQDGTEVTNPTDAGEYDIYAAVAEGEKYNAFAAAKVGTLTINKATLTADNFTFAAPEDLTWDGNAKNATVTFDAQSGKLTGCGNVTIKYNGEAQAPSDAGDYVVSIDVAEGANFAAATALTKEDWKFTIVALATYTRDVTNGNWGTICLPWASVALEGGLFYDVLGTKDPAQGVALAELGESDQLTAGKPYVFRATSNQIKVTYSPATEVEEEVPGNNIIGSFDGCNVPEGMYIIMNNLLYKTADATSTIGENRAYFNVENMGVYTPAQAPGRKVVFMGGKTMPTGDEQVTGNSEQVTGKFLYKRQFVIVKEGKMYNALGM